MTAFLASRCAILAWLRGWLLPHHKQSAIAIMVVANITMAYPVIAADPPAPGQGVTAPGAIGLLDNKPIWIGKPPAIFAPKFETGDDKPSTGGTTPVRRTIVPVSPVRSAPKLLVPGAMQDDASTQNPVAGQITETALQSLSVDALGTIGDGEFAFPRSFWFSLSRARIVGLIETLPVNTDSPGIRSLLRRLLLSPLDVPESDQAGNDGNSLATTVVGVNEPGPPRFPRGKVSGRHEGDVLSLRLRALLLLGELDGARRLIELTPASLRHPGFDAVALEAALLRHDDELSCRLQHRLSAVWADRLLDRIGIWCALREKQFDLAMARLEIDHEMDLVDSTFVNLVHAARRNQANSTNIATIRPGAGQSLVKLIVPAELDVFKIALLGDHHLTLRGSAELSLAIRHSLIASDRLDALERVELGEDMLIRGVIALRRLAGWYRRITVDASDATVGLDAMTLPDLPNPQLHAWIYQRFIQLRDAAGRGALIRSLFADRLSLSDQERRVRMALALPSVQAISPSRPLIWLAPQAVRILINAGEWDLASDWIRLTLAEFSQTSPLIQPRDIDEIWVLGRFAGLEPAMQAFRIERLHSLIEARQAGNADPQNKLSGFATAILRAADGRDRIGKTLASAIEVALAGKRYGEALVLALQQIHPTEFVRSSPQSIEGLLRVLARLSLPRDAAKLATELILSLSY